MIHSQNDFGVSMLNQAIAHARVKVINKSAQHKHNVKKCEKIINSISPTQNKYPIQSPEIWEHDDPSHMFMTTAQIKKIHTARISMYKSAEELSKAIIKMGEITDIAEDYCNNLTRTF